AGVVEFVGGELGGGVFEFGGVDGAVGVAVEVAFAAGANVCRTGSHRAVRRSGGAPTDKPDPPRIVGAPAPGANACPPGSHRGGAPTKEPGPTCVVGAPSGCECVPARFAPGAVLLQTNPAAGVYSARVQVEVRPNMGVPTKPRSLSTLSPSRVMRPW